MAKMNWSQDDGSLKPGVYLAAVKDATEKTSKNGDPYFSLLLQATDFGKKLCHDTLMLAGGGWGIGKAKLSVLGFKDEPEINAYDLVGRTCYVAVKEGEYNGQKKLEVDIRRGKGGYFELAPDGVLTPAPPTAEETPFG